MDNPVAKNEKNYRRRHVTVACESCQDGHKRCDEGSPCKNCKRKNCLCIRNKPISKRGRKSRTHNKLIRQ